MIELLRVIGNGGRVNNFLFLQGNHNDAQAVGQHNNMSFILL